MGSRLIAALAALLLVIPGAALAKIKADETFVFPAGKPVRIIFFRPDVKVGSLGVGSVEEPNADWTAAARAKLTAEVAANQKAAGNEIVFMPEQEGDNAQIVADYQALFRVVAGAIAQHKMFPGASLPTKAERFDWTLGPGAAKLGEIGGGDYALFVSTHDAYGTAGRKVAQLLFAGMFGGFIPAGIHSSYAALVDLRTGNIVWFNVDPGSGGDVRTDEGATKRIGQLLNKF
ncbi:MAG: hypothetical protein J0I73_12100, partial [Sphingomonas sp.]|uniref:hypothetical protein n=2 Tax=unclassified Sphingomonas TaxID=196159 RepID=UPI001AD55409